MRYQGKITEWNEGRGFGFITWNGGGDKIFAHVSSFRKNITPTVGLIVTYELGADDRNRPRANRVELASRSAASTPGKGAVQSSKTGLGILLGAFFMAGVAGAAVLGRLPWILVAWLVGLSVLSFLLYGWDKASAQSSRDRIPEATLHIVDLAGGWPGAAIAQRLFRHKTRKESFRAGFWMTVCLNIAAVIWLAWSGNAIEVLRAFADS